MKKSTAPLVLGLISLVLGSIAPASAVNVSFKGKLVDAIPCSIDNGRTIEIDFGNGIIIRKIDGVEYRKPVPFSITCPGTGNVRMSLQGTPVSFDNAALQTDVTGLGLHFTQSGRALELNRSIPVDLSAPLDIAVAPVVNPAQPPSPGAFKAGATLMAEYN